MDTYLGYLMQFFLESQFNFTPVAAAVDLVDLTALREAPLVDIGHGLNIFMTSKIIACMVSAV